MNALLLAMMLAQPRNVVVVTLDGLRPEEVFEGAQRSLMHGVEEEQGLVDKYWRENRDARREALMPFFWKTVAREGQVFGNASLGSPMRVTNASHCSYPGYAEMFTGFADANIRDNKHGPNENVTVLEWLDTRTDVQVFATWDTFNRIFNVERSHLDVRAGLNPPFANDVQSPTRATIDALFRTTTPIFGGNALDALTFAALRESLRTNRPHVLFLGLGETDEWAHAGRYDLTLEAAHRADALIAELWRYLMTLEEYAGNTTLIITTDHGRGVQSHTWQHHGADIDGSENVWAAVMGPQIPALGCRTATRVTQSQLAATIAQAAGFDWNAEEPRAAQPIPLLPVMAAKQK
jgi:hypothetical protein